MSFLFGGTPIPTKAANVALALLRIFTGLAMALAHGYGKVPPSDRFIQGVAKNGFPVPSFFAWAAGSAELFGGVFLAAGFMTRVSAFFVSVTMLVAGMIAHAADPFAKKEKALLFLFISIFYMIVGAGRYSIDGMIKRQDEIMNEDSW